MIKRRKYLHEEVIAGPVDIVHLLNQWQEAETNQVPNGKKWEFLAMGVPKHKWRVIESRLPNICKTQIDTVLKIML